MTYLCIWVPVAERHGASTVRKGRDATRESRGRSKQRPYEFNGQGNSRSLGTVSWNAEPASG
ncbi:MAG: hypothetical protein ACRD33_02290 [Candidatus Acidiferrales bacterium]